MQFSACVHVCNGKLGNTTQRNANEIHAACDDIPCSALHCIGLCACMQRNATTWMHCDITQTQYNVRQYICNAIANALANAIYSTPMACSVFATSFQDKGEHYHYSLFVDSICYVSIFMLCSVSTFSLCSVSVFSLCYVSMFSLWHVRYLDALDPRSARMARFAR